MIAFFARYKTTVAPKMAPIYRSLIEWTSLACSPPPLYACFTKYSRKVSVSFRLKVIQYEKFEEFVDDADKVLDTMKFIEVDEKLGRGTARFFWRFMWVQYQTGDKDEIRDLEERHGFRRAKLYETVEISSQ